MTDKKFSELEAGNVVRHKDSGNGYIVTGNYGIMVSVVRTINIVNPKEWIVVSVNAKPPVSFSNLELGEKAEKEVNEKKHK